MNERKNLVKILELQTSWEMQKKLLIKKDERDRERESEKERDRERERVYIENIYP